MRYKKVLLVNPPIAESYLGPIRPPAGLGYLAQRLEENSIEHEVLDMALGRKLKHLCGKIDKFKPDLIGVTIWTYKYKDTYGLIEAIKKKYPGISIVAGGPHISTLRADAVYECSAIDYGVVLEGENTLLELCQGKDFREIKGLLYREGQNIIYNGDREFINELDSIHFPKYNKFELNKYFLKEVTIISSRGCPHNCIYCPVNLAIGRRLRTRSPMNVVSEIEYWYNNGYRRFNFADDNFTFFKERTYEICDEIKNRSFTGLDLRCGNGIRADKVDKPLLKRMKEIGFNYIGLGVEAGNNRILKKLNKGETIEIIDETIKDACSLGYDVTLFFLAGSPGETLSDIEDSINLAEKYPIFEARFYNIIPYPGTELFKQLKEKNLFLEDPREYLNNASAFSDKPLFKTEEFPADERVKLFARLRKIENKILKKTIKRKLRKYGWLGIFFSNFISVRFIYYLIRHQKIMRCIFEKIRLSRKKGLL